jgi:N-acetylglucosamine-6-phosphate deacetylase
VKARSVHGRAFIGGALVDDAVITFDRHILNVAVNAAHEDAERVEGVILPGLVDLHVHGAAGADFMDGSPEAARAVAGAHARTGTTALAATTLSGSASNVRRAAAAIATLAHERPTDCAEIAAIHFEGPYISPARAGAQDQFSIRGPDLAEAEEFFAAARGLPAIMTIAPEIEGMHALMEKFHQSVIFSIGHTNASFGEALDAIARGARHVTHLFNAMTPLHHREPGVVGAALISEEVTAELIADGLHIHPAMLRYFARALEGRACLVTDAMRACGMPPGTFKLYEHDVTVDEGAARLPDGTLAGSVLSMIKAVQNMVELAGLPLEMVVPMATSVPARVIGLHERKGRIETGLDADFVVISERFNVERVIIRGRELDLS